MCKIRRLSTWVVKKQHRNGAEKLLRTCPNRITTTNRLSTRHVVFGRSGITRVTCKTQHDIVSRSKRVVFLDRPDRSYISTTGRAGRGRSCDGRVSVPYAVRYEPSKARKTCRVTASTRGDKTDSASPPAVRKHPVCLSDTRGGGG